MSSVKFRYPYDGFYSGTRVTLLGRGVDASGPSGRVRKGAAFLQRVAAAGAADRVTLIVSAMEELDAEGEFDLIIINISMHECRDIDEVTTRIYRALQPGGYFVNSDVPFPTDEQGLRSVPGRVMSGIQFFEARIGDQLLPVADYLDLLNRHGFGEVDYFDITPVHAVTHGRK